MCEPGPALLEGTSGSRGEASEQILVCPLARHVLSSSYFGPTQQVLLSAHVHFVGSVAQWAQ